MSALKGRMLWFNEDRGDGVIEAEDGDRYQVIATDFVAAPPAGRCAGITVSFDGVEGRAFAVAVVHDDVPRRARMRRSGR